MRTNHDLTPTFNTSARYQFMVLWVIFVVVLSLYSAWLLSNHLKTLAIISDLEERTVPAMVDKLRVARLLDSLRFEADNVIQSPSAEQSTRRLYYATLYANTNELQNDPVMGALAAEAMELLSGFEFKRRAELADAWSALSDRMNMAAEQLYIEAVTMGNQGILSVKHDLTVARLSSIWMLALGVSLQLLMVAYTAITFIRPLKQLGEHLAHMNSDPQGQAIDLKSRIAEFKAIEDAVNRLRDVMQANRAMNAALVQRESQLQHEMALSDESMRFKTEFISTISHEIRTPVTAMTIGIYMLRKQRGMDAAQQQQLEVIQQCSNHLLELVNQVLDFSKIEARMLKLEAIAFDLANVLQETQALHGNAAAAKGLAFSIRVAQGTPERLVGDPLRVKEIIFNLVSNAIKFTDQGSVQLVLSAQALESQRALLNITVRDTGIGLTERQVTQLFQQFSQADGSISRRYGGTGLGLAITKKLVELMGGNVVLHSEPGQGAEFACTLWVGLQPGTPPGALCAPSPSTAHTSASPHTPNTPPEPWHLPSATDGSPAAAIGNHLLHLCLQDDPVAHAYLSTHTDVLQERLGPHAQALTQAIHSYALHEAAALLQRLGCAPTQGATPEKPAARQAPARATVLITDDTPATITTLVHLLGGEHRLRVASGGARALAIAQSTPALDVILLDVSMPGMDGMAVLAQLKTHPATRHMPVIMVTANTSTDIQEQALALGADDVVEKPVSPPVLRTRINLQIELARFRQTAMTATTAASAASPTGPASSRSPNAG